MLLLLNCRTFEALKDVWYLEGTEEDGKNIFSKMAFDDFSDLTEIFAQTETESRYGSSSLLKVSTIGELSKVKLR